MVQNFPLPYIVVIKLSSIYIYSEYRVDVDIMARKITSRKKKKKIWGWKLKRKRINENKFNCPFEKKFKLDSFQLRSKKREYSFITWNW